MFSFDSLENKRKTKKKWVNGQFTPPGGNYMFKVNNRNNRTISEIFYLK